MRGKKVRFKKAFEIRRTVTQTQRNEERKIRKKTSKRPTPFRILATRFTIFKDD